MKSSRSSILSSEDTIRQDCHQWQCKKITRAGVINQWNRHIVESEKKYRDHISATYEVVASTRASTIPAATTTAAPTAPETQNSSTRVKTAEVRTSIESKRVAAEGKELDKEIKRHNDWGDGSNEKIDEAMRNIEEWRKHLSKIQDRVYIIEENVQLFNLSSVELTTSVNMMENIKEEMEILAALAFISEKSRGILSPRGIFKTFKSQENFSQFLFISWDSLRFVQTLPRPREVLSISRDLQTNFINKH